MLRTIIILEILFFKFNTLVRENNSNEIHIITFILKIF